MWILVGLLISLFMMGLDVYSSWNLKKELKKFRNSQKKLF